MPGASLRLSQGRDLARMKAMLGDTVSIIGIILLLAAAGGFIAILVRQGSGSGCGCSCSKVICRPRISDEAGDKQQAGPPTAPSDNSNPESGCPE